METKKTISMELLKHKKLLELLSPFADKTLSEGCIMVDEKMLCKYIINKGLKGNITFNDGFIRTKEKIDSHIFISILGHIGITNIFSIPNLKIVNSDSEFIYLQYGKYGKEFKILNKELHLQNKEQLQQLYNDLKVVI